MNHKATTIAEYIEQYDGIVRQRLAAVNDLIVKLTPDAVPTISYGMPAYKLDDKIYVYFSAAKEHIGMYPGRVESYDYNQKIKAYASGKSTLQFKHSVPLPLDVIQEFLEHRIAEIRG